MEREVRAPRLVHHQRHAVRVRHLGQRRPRRRPRRSRWATRRSRRPRPACRDSARSSASGVMQCAMCSSGSSSGATNVGRSPDRISASIVLECALRWITTRSPACASVSSATWLPCDAPLIRNQVRRAPHASAASSCASRNGVGSSPTSMPVRERGDVERERALAERLEQARVRARAALVAGHVEAARVAGGVRAQRVEIGRVRLAGQSPASLGAEVAQRPPRRPPRASRPARRPRSPSVPSPTTGLPAFSASAISDSVP